MLKRRHCLPTALLALTLSLAAAQAARAQDSSAAAKPDASAAAKTDGAQVASAGAESPQPSRQTTRQQQGTQTGGSSQQRNPNLPAPLTAEQKINRAFRSAFLSPVPYAMSAFTAGITQLREDRQPQKDNADEVADWGSRAARNFATRTTTTVFTSGFYAALFKQDPRYERSQSKKFMPRVGHAISRVFVTRDDDGNLEPNYSRFAGSFTASALANVWEKSTPGHDRIGTDATLRRFGRSFISGAISNILIREFGPDIIGIFRR